MVPPFFSSSCRTLSGSDQSRFTRTMSFFMSLDILADHIADAATSGQTPVLVTPSYLSFRPAFFRELAMIVSTRTERPVRVDRTRSGGGTFAMIGDTIARLHAARATRAMGRFGRVQVTALIGRPDSDLTVIGWCCAGEALPAWASAIELGERPIMSPDSLL